MVTAEKEGVYVNTGKTADHTRFERNRLEIRKQLSLETQLNIFDSRHTHKFFLKNIEMYKVFRGVTEIIRLLQRNSEDI